MATEAIFTCRGKDLETSDPKTYNQPKLISWMSKNLPSLVQLSKIGENRKSLQKSMNAHAPMSDMF